MGNDVTGPLELLLAFCAVVGVAKYAIARKMSGFLWSFAAAVLMVAAIRFIPLPYVRVFIVLGVAIAALEGRHRYM